MADERLGAATDGASGADLTTIGWSLLAVFIAMFIDVYVLTHLPVVQRHFDAVTHL